MSRFLSLSARVPGCVPQQVAGAPDWSESRRSRPVVQVAGLHGGIKAREAEDGYRPLAFSASSLRNPSMPPFRCLPCAVATAASIVVCSQVPGSRAGNDSTSNARRSIGE